MRRGPLAFRLPLATFLPALVSCAARTADRPAVPPVVGDLAVEVRYPPAGSAVTATDSTFVFGAVQGASGAATSVIVNGVAAEVEFSSMDQAEKNDPVCLIGVRLHVLVRGASFDLHARKAFAPAVSSEQ